MNEAHTYMRGEDVCAAVAAYADSLRNIKATADEHQVTVAYTHPEGLEDSFAIPCGTLSEAHQYMRWSQHSNAELQRAIRLTAVHIAPLLFLDRLLDCLEGHGTISYDRTSKIFTLNLSNWTFTAVSPEFLLNELDRHGELNTVHWMINGYRLSIGLT